MKLTIKSVALAGAIAVAVPLTPALGQNSEPVLEEIIVTIKGRESSQMTVPVALTSVTGADIDESGIRDMFELQQNVPSLIVGQSQSTTTSNFAIRSVGSTSNNFGVESSVGLYVDDVYRSRQSSMINELIDVASVDVLRGPQGTLFGKNTAAGAISIRTLRPGDGRSFVELSAGDYGFGRIAAAGDFALTDTTGFRATVFASQRDGYVDDINFGSDKLNDRDRQGFRLQLANTDRGSTFDWRIIADYAQIDEVCCVALSRVDNLYSRASLSGVPQPGTDALLLAFGGTVFTDFPYPQPFLDALAPLPGTIV
ncbi:MAG: TonB-dependent receptor plug domain-containing protein, partial [Woeseiaceae bacterium]|nr:TonB-dependent receptor plug domain-containing protein [Woeseiaceae bacterium]